MESVRNVYSDLCRFCQSVVEWRSPATGPYLLAVNSLFWLSAFYCEHLLQMRMLLSIAVGVVSWDILLSTSRDHNIATHMVMWPVRSLWRTVGVLLSVYSWQLLRIQEIESACWAAYGTIGCLLVNPVWSANHVNDKIVNGATYVGISVGNGFNRFVVTPVKAVFSTIVYVVTFQWITRLWSLFIGGLGNAWGMIVTSVKNGTYAVKEWWINYVVEPVRRAIYAIGRFFRYWFCAHWWPGLKAWMAVHIGEPCRRAFNYVCFCLLYVFCGHWIPPLARWMKGHLDAFVAFLYRTVVEPTKQYLWRKFDEFRGWLRSQLHQLAVAIRDSVIWPICVLVVDAGRELSLLVYRIAIKPVLDYIYQRYKILETVALIYILGPICKVFINNIPEKNPFCEESDVELDGMLPDEMSDVDEQAIFNDYPEEADFLPSAPLTDSHDWTINSKDRTIAEEERDFVTGLDFPDVDLSESSDEEFDLKKPKRVVRMKKKVVHTERIAGGYDDTFEELH